MKTEEEIKREKDKKQTGCITAVIIILIIAVCWFLYGPGLPPYSVRLQKVGTNNNANIEIVIPDNLNDKQIQDIAMKEADRYTNQRYVFVFFYTKGKYDCFATSHSKDNYEVKRLLQVK